MVNMELKKAEQLLSPGNVVSKKHSNYEYRPEQIKMSKKVKEAILDKHHLIVEAGTGIGKSLSYLIPFLIWTKKENKKVVISTYTKTLQEQLVKNDLPFLKNILDIDFKFALSVGGENYLCLRRLAQVLNKGLLDTKKEVQELKKIGRWEKETKSGLRFTMDFQISNKTWSNIRRESDLCLGKKCQYRESCYYAKVRKEQAESEVLVVNHHLFFANLVTGGRIIPKYDSVVFDEAHTLEDVATNYLGIEVANTQINFLLNRIYNPNTEKGIVSRVTTLAKDESEYRKIVKKIAKESNLFFSSVLDRLDSKREKKRLKTPHLFDNTLSPYLKKLSDKLINKVDDINSEEDSKEVTAYSDRAMALASGLTAIIDHSLVNNVYWIETNKKSNYTRCAFHSCPIDVSGELKRRVFDVTNPTIITSATLTTNKSFKFIKERIGLTETEESLLDSPFDYRNQVILYIAGDLSDPSYYYESYKKDLSNRIRKILKMTKGGTLTLFTSYEMLEASYNFLKELENIDLLKQGDLPRWLLLKQFKADSNKVLLATYSFWQGIDIPGEDLKCVIITKLPFAVPNEPVTEAKIEDLAQRGIEPFMNYQVPQAIIMLRQGFGRLIRTKKDKGIVAILDPRIRTRAYGKQFLNSLPNCKLSSDSHNLKNFAKKKV